MYILMIHNLNFEFMISFPFGKIINGRFAVFQKITGDRTSNRTMGT